MWQREKEGEVLNHVGLRWRKDKDKKHPLKTILKHAVKQHMTCLRYNDFIGTILFHLRDMLSQIEKSIPSKENTRNKQTTLIKAPCKTI